MLAGPVWPRGVILALARGNPRRGLDHVEAGRVRQVVRHRADVVVLLADGILRIRVADVFVQRIQRLRRVGVAIRVHSLVPPGSLSGSLAAFRVQFWFGRSCGPHL